MKKKLTFLCLYFQKESMSKIFLRMKLLVFFLLIALTSVSAKSYSQASTMTFNFEDVNVIQVFREIERNSDYILIYNEKTLDVNRKVTVKADNDSIETILDKVFNGTKNNYKISGRQIVISESELATPVTDTSTYNAELQQVVITGTVTDEKGNTLPGVTVTVKGTTLGTLTDASGKYIINNATRDATLIFSFVGMAPQEIKIGASSQINVTMVESAIGLDEVVVIGYGTAKRRDVMGAVSSVNADDLTKAPVASALEAMAGSMAGVHVTRTDGNPDATIDIRVRGGGSITGDNSPLFILDGFPVDNINDIAPSDIESISVLKDASSTAIYGSRGAYGVVIVTTKSGDKSGKMKVSYNSFYAVKKIAKKLNVLTPHDFVKFQYELAALSNTVDTYYEPVFGKYEDMDLYSGMVGNNWQDQIFGNIGTAFNNNLSVRGGSNVINYFVSYDNIKDIGIMLNSEYRRDNFNLKLNSNPSKKITLDFSARYSNTRIEGGGTNSFEDFGNSGDGSLAEAVLYSPIPVSGMIETVETETDASDLVDPIVTVNDNDRNRRQRTWNANGSLGWEIIDNLKFKSELGLNDYFQDYNRFYGLSTYYAKNMVGDYVNMPATIEQNIYKKTMRYTNTLNYDFKKLLGDQHSLNLLFGQERIVAVSSSVKNEVWGLPAFFDSDMAFHFMSSGKASVISHFYDPDDKLLSFFSRLNYSFRDKYLFSATFRADGSNKFVKANRWGYFPSVSVGWRLSEEEFIKTDWLYNLKLRFSYGVAGNNNIPSGQMSKTFSASATSFINTSTSYWSSGTVLDNPDLKWESTYTRNLGIDFGVLKNRLNGTIDLYQNNTKDLLMKFPVAGSGYDYQFRNMGETENKGIELSLNYTAIAKRDYSLSFSFNIGINRTKIISMGVMEDYGIGSGWASTAINIDYWIAKNGAVGDLYGYRIDGNGRYEVSDFQEYDQAQERWILKDGVPGISASILGHNVRPGDLKLKDINGIDGVTASDREILGNTNPKHTGGFSIAGRFKSFDLTANFNWVYGNKIYNANKIDFTSTSQTSYRNMIDMMADGKRWTNLLPDGTISNDPEELVNMNATTTMWSPNIYTVVLTDWAIEDGSFLRLSTLSLGYTIPDRLTNKLKISSLRFYVTGYNVFCWTNYSGYDPEVSTERYTTLTPGVDYSAYPKSRQIAFGVNLNF
jgi:TonB-dependent starch-binding outer membrane protein SusC